MGLSNKRTLPVSTRELMYDLQNKLREANCDPIKELADIAMNENNALDLRVGILKELAQYVAPKRRAVDVSLDNDSQLTVTIKKFSDSPETPKRMMKPEEVAKEMGLTSTEGASRLRDDVEEEQMELPTGTTGN